MVLPLTGARSLGKIRDSWNGTGEPIFALIFNSPDLNLATAVPGSFTLTPSRDMAAALRRDYTAVSGMIFGEAPHLNEILEGIADFEKQTNAGQTGAPGQAGKKGVS
jgi:hypothetical protein